MVCRPWLIPQLQRATLTIIVHTTLLNHIPVAQLMDSLTLRIVLLADCLDTQALAVHREVQSRHTAPTTACGHS